MARIVTALVLGMLAAFLAIWAIDLIGHQFYPVPSDIRIGDSEAMASLIRGMPPGARAFIVAAWFGGALVGAGVANGIARRRWTAWPVAALVALGSVVNVLMIPHPEWMQIGAVVAPLLGGLIAAHLVRPGAGAAPRADEGADARL